MNTWEAIQAKIWTCDLCCKHERVACNIRQQTQKPDRPVKLLLIGIAPPYVSEVTQKTPAKSATNDANDNLRKFIEETLRCSWNNLLLRGLFLVHSVKCAIVPKDRHQNPPDDVVDACAPQHFGEELKLIRPPRVVAFGKTSYRALLKAPGVTAPRDLGVSKSVATLVKQTKGGLEVQADGWKFKLHVSPFPLVAGKPDPIAVDVLREAARLSGILP